MVKKSIEQRKVVQAFEALALREDASYDPGLVQFRRAMQNAERVLNHHRSSAEAVGIIEELNAKWPYHGKEVTLSGRIYLNDADADMNIDDYLPDAWGEKKMDEWGTFYEVEDALLVSMGLDEIEGRSKKSKGSTISFVYGFDAEDDEATFIVRPNDISHVDYPYPTYEACEAHLRHEYPELFAEINRLVRPSTYDFNRLGEVLQHLIGTFPELCSDSTLGGWAAVYINRRVKFDRESPYGFVIQGEMAVTDEDGDDEIYTLEEPFAFDATIGSIAFAETYHEGADEEFTPSVHYLVFLPSGITSSQEYVESRATIPVSSIISLESRRPVISVAEQLRTARLEKVRPMLAQLGMVRLADMSVDIENEPYEEVEEEVTNEALWRDLEVRFAAVVERVLEVRNTKFRSLEAAQVVADTIMQEMNALLHENNVLYTSALYVSGAGVGVPMVKTERTATETGQQISFSVDGDMHNPVRAVDVFGTFRSLYATVEQEDEESFVPLIYTMMGHKEDVGAIPMLAFESFPLVAATIGQIGMVRMDGTATLEIAGLERIRRKDAALRELASIHGARREKEVIGRLSQAIKQELADSMVSLRDLGIVKDVEDIMLTSRHTNEVSAALKALLGDGRQLIISGEAVSVDGEPKELSRAITACIDVVNMISHRAQDTPALVVKEFHTALTPEALQNEPPLMYMPLKNITELKY